MKVLVVFYSRTDNNRKVAREIAEVLKADVGEVLPVVSYGGFFGWLKGGFHALRGVDVEFSCPKSPEGYDLVVLVGPLWAGRLAPPIRAYVVKNRFRKVAFFSCNGSGKTQNSLEQLRKLGCVPLESGFVSENDFKDNLHHDKVIEFCESVKKLMKKK